MTDIVPVTREAHGHSYWARPADYAFAAGFGVVPIWGFEIGRAAGQMPLAFVRAKAGVQLVGLLGLRQDENLFVGADGKWLGRYVPATFRAYPFRLASGPKGDVLAFDASSGLLDQGDERFFTDEGELSPSVKSIMEVLQLVRTSMAPTRAACAAFDEAGLLQPWGEVGPQGQNALLRIDERKLHTLDETLFLGLRKHGGLGIAYAQSLSMFRIETLKVLEQLRESGSPPADGGTDIGWSLPGSIDFDPL